MSDNSWYGTEEWLVDQCACGHHISAHPKGLGACRRHDEPGECTGYRWDGVGLRIVSVPDVEAAP